MLEGEENLGLLPVAQEEAAQQADEANLRRDLHRQHLSLPVLLQEKANLLDILKSRSSGLWIRDWSLQDFQEEIGKTARDQSNLWCLIYEKLLNLTEIPAFDPIQPLPKPPKGNRLKDWAFWAIENGRNLYLQLLFDEELVDDLLDKIQNRLHEESASFTERKSRSLFFSGAHSQLKEFQACLQNLSAEEATERFNAEVKRVFWECLYMGDPRFNQKTRIKLWMHRFLRNQEENEKGEVLDQDSEEKLLNGIESFLSQYYSETRDIATDKEELINRAEYFIKTFFEHQEQRQKEAWFDGILTTRNRPRIEEFQAFGEWCRAGNGSDLNETRRTRLLKELPNLRKSVVQLNSLILNLRRDFDKAVISSQEVLRALSIGEQLAYIETKANQADDDQMGVLEAYVEWNKEWRVFYHTLMDQKKSPLLLWLKKTILRRKEEATLEDMPEQVSVEALKLRIKSRFHKKKWQGLALAKIRNGKGETLEEFAIRHLNFEALFILNEIASRQQHTLSATSDLALTIKQNRFVISLLELKSALESDGIPEDVSFLTFFRERLEKVFELEFSPFSFEKLCIMLNRFLEGKKRNLSSNKLSSSLKNLSKTGKYQELVSMKFEGLVCYEKGEQSYIFAACLMHLGGWQVLQYLHQIGLVTKKVVKSLLILPHPDTQKTVMHACLEEDEWEGVEYCLAEGMRISPEMLEVKPAERSVLDRVVFSILPSKSKTALFKAILQGGGDHEEVIRVLKDTPDTNFKELWDLWTLGNQEFNSDSAWAKEGLFYYMKEVVREERSADADYGIQEFIEAGKIIFHHIKRKPFFGRSKENLLRIIEGQLDWIKRYRAAYKNENTYAERIGNLTLNYEKGGIIGFFQIVKTAITFLPDFSTHNPFRATESLLKELNACQKKFENNSYLEKKSQLSSLVVRARKQMYKQAQNTTLEQRFTAQEEEVKILKQQVAQLLAAHQDHQP